MSLLTSGVNLYDLAGSSTGNNSALTVSGGQLYLSGSLVVAGETSLITGMSGVYNAGFAAFPKVTGSFTITPSFAYRYLWSGAIGTTGIATLPVASGAGVSGVEYIVKNIATGTSLILSGTVDYATNYTILGPSAVTLISAGDTSWILV